MSLIPAERSDLNQSVICAVCKCHGHMHAVCEVIVEFGPSMTLGTGAYSIGIIITNAYLAPATLLEITCSQKFKDNPHAPGIFAYLQVSHQASGNCVICSTWRSNSCVTETIVHVLVLFMDSFLVNICSASLKMGSCDRSESRKTFELNL